VSAEVPRSSVNTPLLEADITGRVGANAVEPVLRRSADVVTMTAWLVHGTPQVNGQRRIPDA
jgi:hypothetical protein